MACPECGNEWSAMSGDGSQPVVRDAVGIVLNERDTVTVVKDLKLADTSSVVKRGTKVRDIRLVGGDDDVDCKVAGFGQIGLKSQFVKKVT